MQPDSKLWHKEFSHKGSPVFSSQNPSSGRQECQLKLVHGWVLDVALIFKWGIPQHPRCTKLGTPFLLCGLHLRAEDGNNCWDRWKTDKHISLYSRPQTDQGIPWSACHDTWMTLKHSCTDCPDSVLHGHSGITTWRLWQSHTGKALSPSLVKHQLLIKTLLYPNYWEMIVLGLGYYDLGCTFTTASVSLTSH